MKRDARNEERSPKAPSVRHQWKVLENRQLRHSEASQKRHICPDTRSSAGRRHYKYKVLFQSDEQAYKHYRKIFKKVATEAETHISTADLIDTLIQ